MLCKGTRKSGEPCHRMTAHPSGFCKHHIKQADVTEGGGTRKQKKKAKEAAKVF